MLAAVVNNNGSLLSSPVWVIIGGIIAAAISGLVAWQIAKRTSSGRIDTTEAAKLWEESQAMRRELRDAYNTLQSRCDKLEEKSEQHRQEAEQCLAREQELRSDIAKLQGQMRTLKRRPRV